MKHLFIINPCASKLQGKGKVQQQQELIAACFKQGAVAKMRDTSDYDMHITRWSRDAVSFVKRYVAESDNVVRVHAMGGSGTLFEIVNGVFGLPNVEIAAYPLGRSNRFIRYFGEHNSGFFCDIANQVRSRTIQVDALYDGVNYGLANSVTGIEAEVYREVGGATENTMRYSDTALQLLIALRVLRKEVAEKDFTITLNEDFDISGCYVSVLVANVPCYSAKLNPAVDARPDNGMMDVYTIQHISRCKSLQAIPLYGSGRYRELSDMCKHYRCKKIEIKSEGACSTFDGEDFYTVDRTYSVKPAAIPFVLPEGVDVGALPDIYGG